MKLYHLLGRLIGPFRVAAFIIINHFWHIPRVRVLVRNEAGEFLLVRTWAARQQWGLPGGGVKRRESAASAARRELYEEVGVNLPEGDFRYVTTLDYTYQAPVFVVSIRRRELPASPHNPREITHLEWFAEDKLPADLSPLVPLALKELSKTK